jgi:hypothetical protein
VVVQGRGRSQTHCLIHVSCDIRRKGYKLTGSAQLTCYQGYASSPLSLVGERIIREIRDFGEGDRGGIWEEVGAEKGFGCLIATNIPQHSRVRPKVVT